MITRYGVMAMATHLSLASGRVGVGAVLPLVCLHIRVSSFPNSFLSRAVNEISRKFHNISNACYLLKHFDKWAFKLIESTRRTLFCF